VAGFAFILAVAQLLAVATFEVGVTNGGGARRSRWRLLLLLLLTARGRRTSGRAPVFESLEPKIQGINFLVEAVGRSVCISRESRGRGGGSSIDGHRSGCRSLRGLLEMLKLAGSLECPIKSGQRSLQEFVTQRRAEVGDEQVQRNMIKG
jgi:hypothetical protein